MEHIGANIKKLREGAGMSQPDLAKKLGLTGRAGICNYEKGVSFPSLKVVHDMSEIFNVSMDDIVKRNLLESK
jgi:transcriptional regulator with XRE-family HTH domain